MQNRRKGKIGHMAVKLNISKAYDRVEWNFLQHIMLKIVLPVQWVDMAIEVVQTATYSVLNNGLSSMLRRATDTRELHGITSCRGGVQISHLLFANDSLLFCEAIIGECHRLLDILAKYEAASGQPINRQKTSLFFSRNTRHEVKEETRGLMGAQIMTGCEKYLGLPMVGWKSKVSMFNELQEKVTKRVMGWKEKHISKAGREVLIKTVGQAIPTYSMSLFKIPKTVCDGINSALS
ncbi:hypothetical protein SO802_025810 [Lithocarpus litseifolius]|uniref:Reverse transcriptase domain-containing protein n=1 Tax=Lithocarpus litseifolius TaxID=425828 RepID=A0AAW2C3A0_9ROSI